MDSNTKAKHSRDKLEGFGVSYLLTETFGPSERPPKRRPRGTAMSAPLCGAEVGS
jgi:hypothetical protein